MWGITQVLIVVSLLAFARRGARTPQPAVSEGGSPCASLAATACPWHRPATKDWEDTATAAISGCLSCESFRWAARMMAAVKRGMGSQEDGSDHRIRATRSRRATHNRAGRSLQRDLEQRHQQAERNAGQRTSHAPWNPQTPTASGHKAVEREQRHSRPQRYPGRVL